MKQIMKYVLYFIFCQNASIMSLKSEKTTHKLGRIGESRGADETGRISSGKINLPVQGGLDKTKGELKVNPNKSTIFITIDNVIEKFTINGKEIKMTEPKLNDWKITKKFELPINSGDVLTFRGVNKEGPSGLLATIHFVDENGNKQTISTPTGWSCGGKKPKKLEVNNSSKTLGLRPNIEPLAQWIWVKKSSEMTAECSITVPSA